MINTRYPKTHSVESDSAGSVQEFPLDLSMRSSLSSTRWAGGRV